MTNTDIDRAGILTTQTQHAALPEHEELLENSTSIVPNWPTYLPPADADPLQTFNLLYNLLGHSHQITLHEKLQFLLQLSSQDLQAKIISNHC